MSFAEELADTNPTAGEDAGSQQDQGTQPAAPAAPAGRTYTDSEMAAARRSFESRAARERDAAVSAARAEWQRSQAPKPASDDPWSDFDPEVAKRLRTVFDRELDTRMAPYKIQQDDIAFRNEESDFKSKYPKYADDYAKNRIEVLGFAVRNGIRNPEAAYRAWKFDELSNIDPDAIGKAAIAAHLKRKVTQSAETPLAEGRGGGSPSTKTNFRGKDGKLDKDAMDAHALELMRSAND